MRHPCLWKFVSRNSLSVSMRNSRGTTAVKLGVPWLIKEDRATGRYFCKPSQVYKGTQPAMVVNWSGGHSTRRPSSWSIGSQCSIITSGRSGSDAAARGMRHSEVSMSSQEGVVPASKPRRLHLTCWTQLVSAIKVSYLLGRMSSFNTPLGRIASHRGVLTSSSSVARFFGGDVCGLQSSSGHFWLRAGSLFGTETARGIVMGKTASSSSDMTTAATSSGSGSRRVSSRSPSPCSCVLFLLASISSRDGSGASGLAGASLRPHRPSSAMGDTGFLGISGLLRRQILLTRPDSRGDVRVEAMSSTLHVWKFKS